MSMKTIQKQPDERCCKLSGEDRQHSTWIVFAAGPHWRRTEEGLRDWLIAASEAHPKHRRHDRPSGRDPPAWLFPASTDGPCVPAAMARAVRRTWSGEVSGRPLHTVIPPCGALDIRCCRIGLWTLNDTSLAVGGRDLPRVARGRCPLCSRTELQIAEAAIY